MTAPARDLHPLLLFALRASSGAHSDAARNLVLAILFAQLLADGAHEGPVPALAPAPLQQRKGGQAHAKRHGRQQNLGRSAVLLPPAALLDTLRRAIAAFGDQEVWRALQRAGMADDHSWDRSAAEYVKIYERALRRD